MHSFRGERNQRRPRFPRRRPEGRDPRHLVHTAHEVLPELLLVGVNVLHPHSLHVARRGSHPDRLGDGRGPRLEPRRGRRVGAPPQRDRVDHLASSLVGRQGLQPRVFSPQESDPRGPAEFVSRSDEEVHAERPDVHGHVGDALAGVEHDRAVRVRVRSHVGHYFVHGIDASQGVADVDERDDLRPRGHEGPQVVRVQSGAVGVQPRVFHHQPLRTQALGEHLPRDDVAVVLHGGDDDLRGTGAVFGHQEAVAQGPREKVEALRRAAREHDLLAARGADQLGHGVAGILVGRGRGLAEEVGSAVDVGVHRVVIPAEGVDDLARFLGRRGAVQVYQRFVVSHRPGEDGELRTGLLGNPRVFQCKRFPPRGAVVVRRDAGSGARLGRGT
mmetsp:Transcript_136/g.304  ORF Transcript_136/g.304 Transcript_136/m.304 type:complete len:387 (-) Transcript_136:213-1373(-)